MCKWAVSIGAVGILVCAGGLASAQERKDGPPTGAPGVIVKGSAFELVNARETFEHVIAGEKIPAFLK